jgi:hypothetical protein
MIIMKWNLIFVNLFGLFYYDFFFSLWNRLATDVGDALFPGNLQIIALADLCSKFTGATAGAFESRTREK